jgi:hypothetical protein
VVLLLGRAENPQSVRLLAEAVHRPSLRADARKALAELAASPQVDVARRAERVLRDSFGRALSNPSAGEDAVAALVELDSTVSVDLLAKITRPESLAVQARAGLATLARSSPATVAVRAGAVLLAQVERALARKAAGRWCVEVLEGIEDPESAHLLGRLAEEANLRDESEAALERMKDSPEPEVTAAAAKELDRLAGRIARTKAAPKKRPESRLRTAPKGDPVLDSHYESILQLMLNGRLVPFIGPGVNLADRPSDSSWLLGAPFLPSGRELMEHLAKRFRYPEDPFDPIVVAQYAELVAGRAPLERALREVFDGPYAPTSLHRVLVRLLRLVRERRAKEARTVVTTAFDDLLASIPHEARWGGSRKRPPVQG